MSGFITQPLRGADVVYWSPGDVDSADRTENFGDVVGREIISVLAPDNGTTLPGRLVSVGSIMHAVEPGDVIWGTGINAKLARPVPEAVAASTVRAVRGPLTRTALQTAGAHVPEVYGDPALLLPRLFPHITEWTANKTREVTVIPNLNDMELYADDPRVVSPLLPLWDVVKEIAQSEFVTGTSLHGVVIAEALGIPARFVSSPVEPPFKYVDYLLGTGREPNEITYSVDRAIERGGQPAPDVDLDALLDAFPADLWGGEPPVIEAPPAEERRDALYSAIERTRHLPRAMHGRAALVSSIADVTILPGIAHVAASLGSRELSSLVSGARMAILTAETEGSTPDRRWVRRAVLTRDEAALRSRSRTPAGSAVVERVEEVGDGYSLRLYGTATVPVRHSGADDCDMAVVRNDLVKPAPLARSTTIAVFDGVRARWITTLDLRTLTAHAQHYELEAAWINEGKQHRATRVRTVPALRDNGPIEVVLPETTVTVASGTDGRLTIAVNTRESDA